MFRFLKDLNFWKAQKAPPEPTITSEKIQEFMDKIQRPMTQEEMDKLKSIGNEPEVPKTPRFCVDCVFCKTKVEYFKENLDRMKEYVREGSLGFYARESYHVPDNAYVKTERGCDDIAADQSPELTKLCTKSIEFGKSTDVVTGEVSNTIWIRSCYGFRQYQIGSYITKPKKTICGPDAEFFSPK